MLIETPYTAEVLLKETCKLPAPSLPPVCARHTAEGVSVSAAAKEQPMLVVRSGYSNTQPTRTMKARCNHKESVNKCTHDRCTMLPFQCKEAGSQEVPVLQPGLHMHSTAGQPFHISHQHNGARNVPENPCACTKPMNARMPHTHTQHVSPVAHIHWWELQWDAHAV